MRFYPTVTNFEIVICDECGGLGISNNSRCPKCDGKGVWGVKNESKKIVDFGIGNSLPNFSFHLLRKKIGLWLKIFLFTLFVAGLISGLILLFKYLSSTSFNFSGVFSDFEMSKSDHTLEALFWLGFLSLGISFYIFSELARPRKIAIEGMRVLSEKEIDNQKDKFDSLSDTKFDPSNLNVENLGNGVTPNVITLLHTQAAKWGYLSPLVIFEGVLNTPKGKEMLQKFALNKKNINSQINELLEKEKLAVKKFSGVLSGYPVLAESHLAFNLALEECFLGGQKFIGVGAISLGVIRTPSGKKIMDILDVTYQDFVNVAHWVNVEFFIKRWRFWKQKTINWTGGIAQDWGYGYTPVLDLFAFDASKAKKRRGLAVHVIGRNNEIEELERLLARDSRRGNVLMVGDPGVGKGAVIRGLASKIASGNTIDKLKGKRIVSVDITSLLSGVKVHGEFEKRLNRLLFEARRSGNIILFIGEVHEVMDASSGTGIDAGEMLRKGLEYGVQMVITTTQSGYKKHIEPRGSMMEYLQLMRLKELTTRQTIMVLEDYAHMFEKKYDVRITYSAIKNSVELSERYIHDRLLPAKAIDILEDAVIRTKDIMKETHVKGETVLDIISQRTGIPINKMTEGDREKLANLEKEFEKYIIGQKSAVKAVSDVLRRSRAGISSQTKPIGSFLFVGPTGVGKTELTRILAKIYYGSEKNIVRLDMSEFQDRSSINRLIGAPAGYEGGGVGGQLTEKVRGNPYTLVLLDELEKAHPDILNIFLQVLEDGRLSDATGRAIDFRNTIVIATSNAGAKLIVEETRKKTESDEVRKKLMDYMVQNNIYKPEFLNRFDKIIYFSPLTHEEAEQVAQILVKKVEKSLQNQRIEIKIAPDAVEYLVEAGYTPEYGARSLRRIIQEKIEATIANKLVSGELQPGGSILVTREMIE